MVKYSNFQVLFISSFLMVNIFFNSWKNQMDKVTNHEISLIHLIRNVYEVIVPPLTHRNKMKTSCLARQAGINNNPFYKKKTCFL